MATRTAPSPATLRSDAKRDRAALQARAIAEVLSEPIDRSPEQELKVTILGACMRALSTRSQEGLRSVLDKLLESDIKSGQKRGRAETDEVAAAPAPPPSSAQAIAAPPPPPTPPAQEDEADLVLYSDYCGPLETPGASCAENTAEAPQRNAPPPSDTPTQPPPPQPHQEQPPSEGAHRPSDGLADAEVVARLGDFVRSVVDLLAGASNVDSLPLRTLTVIAMLIEACSAPPSNKQKASITLWEFHFTRAAPKPRTSGKLRADTLVPATLNVPKAGARGAAKAAGSLGARGPAAAAAATAVPLLPAPLPAAASKRAAAKSASGKGPAAKATAAPSVSSKAASAALAELDALGGLFDDLDNFDTAALLMPIQPLPAADEVRQQPRSNAGRKKRGATESDAFTVDEPTPVFVAALNEHSDASYSMRDLEIDATEALANAELEMEVARVLNVKSFMSHDGIMDFLAKKGFAVERAQLDDVVLRFQEQGFVMVEHGVIYMVG